MFMRAVDSIVLKETLRVTPPSILAAGHTAKAPPTNSGVLGTYTGPNLITTISCAGFWWVGGLTQPKPSTPNPKLQALHPTPQREVPKHTLKVTEKVVEVPSAGDTVLFWKSGFTKIFCILITLNTYKILRTPSQLNVYGAPNLPHLRVQA